MKKILIFLLAAALCFVLAACSSNTEAPQTETAAAAPSEETAPTEAKAAETAAPASSEPAFETETAEETAVHPYAWMGLTDMPRCGYLDKLASRHYMLVTDYYSVLGVSEAESYAVDKRDYVGKQDGVTAYDFENSFALGYRYGYRFYDSDMTYDKYQYTIDEEYLSGITEYEEQIQNGINVTGREFVQHYRDSIPLYSEETGDTAEYEYYEYAENTSPLDNTIKNERFYIKDGDVFAVQRLFISNGAVVTDISYTEVIKSITGDIPEGSFDLPENMDDYTLIE